MNLPIIIFIVLISIYGILRYKKEWELEAKIRSMLVLRDYKNEENIQFLLDKKVEKTINNYNSEEK